MCIIILKIIVAIALSYITFNHLLMSPRDKAIRRAKKEGKSWNEIYNEFYRY